MARGKKVAVEGVTCAIPEVATVEVVTVEEPPVDVVTCGTPEEVSKPTDEVVDTVLDSDKYNMFLDRLQTFINSCKEMMILVKVMQKNNQKLVKSTKKSKKTVNVNAVKRNPSGFAKPTKLSPELCTFLGVDKGTSLARTNVTKLINEYIKLNNLQNASDKRHIIPDAKLSSILSISGDDKLTYFNLQTYIKHHFIKEVPVPVEV